MRFVARRPALFAALSGAILASALLSAPMGGQAPRAAEPTYCDAPVVRREVLRNERGDPLFISPDAMIERDGVVLMAGQFSAEFVRDAKGRYDAGKQNHVLAVLRERDGTTRTFGHFPIDNRVPVDVRAVSLERGVWGVLVLGAVQDSQPKLPRRGTLYFAPLTERGWGDVEVVPLPKDVQPVVPMARHMVRQGDRTIAAMSADSAGEAFGVLLVERMHAKWTSRFIPVYMSSYAAIAIDGGTKELALAVVAIDRTLRRDRNSLFLMYPDRERHSLKLLASGLEAPVHHPRMHTTARGLSVSWTAHERTGAGIRKRAMQLAVESGLPLTPVALLPDPGFVTTIADRLPLTLVVSAYGADSLQITLHSLPAPSAGVRLLYPSSFVEVADATRSSESEVVVALVAAANDGTHLVKELLWIEPRCRREAGRESATDATSPYRSTHHVQTNPLAGSAAAVRKRL